MNILTTDNRNFSVYIHTNLINNKKYVGITCQEPEYRWRNGKGYNHNSYFTNAIQKYGWDNFKHEILYTNLGRDEAIQKEEELILKYHTTQRDYGYNITSGGAYYGCHTEESKKKMSETRKKNITDEHRQMARDRLLSRFESLEALSKYVSDINKNRIYSDEEKEALRKSHKVKPVICIDTGKFYISAHEAARQTNGNAHGIRKACRGEATHSGKMSWRYATLDEIRAYEFQNNIKLKLYKDVS